MLLNSLHVQSHRGIDDLTFSDLASVSLIVGPNNSGKSSILEAIALLLRPLDPSAWIQAARQRDMDADLADALWSIFRTSGVLQLDDGPQQSGKTKLAGVIQNVERSVQARAIASEDWDAEQSGAAKLRVSVKVDALKAHDMIFRRKGSAQWGQGVHPHRCFTVTPMTHRSGRTLVEHLSRVIDDGQKALALELLQLFDPQVNSLDVSAGRRRQCIVVQHEQRGVVDLASFGDGMRRVAALALALSRARGGGALLIDELETGIHPSVLKKVTQRLLTAAAIADVQIVATTHSLEAVDAVIAAAADRQDGVAVYHLFAVDRTQGVRRYDYARLQKLRAAGLDLR